MVKILREGRIPDAAKAWPFNEIDVLRCPVCDTTFRIEESDTKTWYSGDGQVRKEPPWSVWREKRPNGKQKATGPCPFCHQCVTIEKSRIPA
jgi:C4-type Zn-finger protein